MTAPGQPVIRDLDPVTGLPRVEVFFHEAPDYWEMAEGRTPGLEKANDFFTDGPPGCDPAMSYGLGLFLNERLSGLAELSFGFPESNDAYLGFMMLRPWARNAGLGKIFLAHVEQLVCERAASCLFLAVLSANAKGRAYWEREWFRATGLSGVTRTGELEMEVHRLRKTL